MMQLNIVFVKINYCSIFFYDIMAKSPSGQDEENCVFPFGISRIGPTRKSTLFMTFWLYNRSFIDQACLVKIAVSWPHSFWLFY